MKSNPSGNKFWVERYERVLQVIGNDCHLGLFFDHLSYTSGEISFILDALGCALFPSRNAQDVFNDKIVRYGEIQPFDLI